MGVQERLSMQGSSVKAFRRDDRDAQSADKQKPDVASIARDIGTTLVRVVGKHPENASAYFLLNGIRIKNSLKQDKLRRQEPTREKSPHLCLVKA